MARFPYHEKVVIIQLATHKPDKWRFVDMETGEVWLWWKNAFHPVEPGSESLPNQLSQQPD